MSHAAFLEEPAELAALYAAGALTPEERRRFEAHLEAGCAACQAEARQLDGVVSALAAAVAPVAPDPKTRAALLRRVAAAPTPSPLRKQLQDDVPEGPGIFLQRDAAAAWKDTDVPGVRMRVLFVDRPNNHFTALVRMAPGVSYPGHVHDGPEECLVLEGDLNTGDYVMRAGDYIRASAGSRHGVQSTEGGCLLLITSSLSDTFE